ncbi:MAG: hypothetical protein QM813_16955 [Verrucomicrobiota bacterium]
MWIPTDVKNLPQRLMETDTVQNLPFGTVVNGFDPILGAGQFIYLQGVASTVAGSSVTYNPFTGVTTLDAATANDASPIAFALAPTVASLYGWYQISGTAVAANNGTAATGNAFRKATGQIGSAAVAGTQILGGCKILVANGSTFTKTCTTRNGSTVLIVPNLDAVFVGCPISGTGIPGGTTVAAGVNNSPNGSNTSAGSAATLIMSAAATADGTVTVTFTRTNFSLVSGNQYFGQGQIT